MSEQNDFQTGKSYFYDKDKNFKDCTTAQMINGWNNEERLTKNGFTLQNWYQSRSSSSL